MTISNFSERLMSAGLKSVEKTHHLGGVLRPEAGSAEQAMNFDHGAGHRQWRLGLQREGLK